MRQLLFLAFAFTLPLLVSADGTPASAPGAVAPDQPVPTPTISAAMAPKIVFKETAFNFGDVEEGPDITHEFVFHNRGKSTLHINNVGTSCGCTAAVGDKKDIAPGGKGTIKVTYHTSGRPGHATKIITVTSNDPTNPNFQVKIDMTVVREIDVTPDRVYLYAVKHGEEKDTQVKILGKPGKKLNILSVTSNNKVVAVTSAPYSEGDGTNKRMGVTLNVVLPATQPIGSISDNVVVKTDDLKKPEIEIQVMGEVVGRVQWSPKNVYFAPRQEQPVFVNITANPPQGFAVRSVSTEKHLCRPSIKSVNNPDGTVSYQLSILPVKSIPKDSDGKDEVVVNTNDNEMPTFKVDVQTSH